MPNRITPFLKGKRKYRTIIYGGLPILLSAYLTVQYVLFYLCGLAPKSHYLQILLLLPALLPGYLIYAMISIPMYFIGLFLKLISAVLPFEADMPGNTFRNIVMTVTPIPFYIFLFLLFLRYCYCYDTKKIRSLKKMKRILTATWVILSSAFIIAVLSFINIL